MPSDILGVLDYMTCSGQWNVSRSDARCFQGENFRAGAQVPRCVYFCPKVTSFQMEAPLSAGALE